MAVEIYTENGLGMSISGKNIPKLGKGDNKSNTWKHSFILLKLGYLFQSNIESNIFYFDEDN